MYLQNLRKAFLSLTAELCLVHNEKAMEKALKKVRSSIPTYNLMMQRIISLCYLWIKKTVQFMEKARYLDVKRKNETSKYMKLMLNVIYRLTHVISLVCGCIKASENSEDQKTNVSERRDVLEMLLMFAGLEKETHKANFATFMNVIVSQR